MPWRTARLASAAALAAAACALTAGAAGAAHGAVAPAAGSPADGAAAFRARFHAACAPWERKLAQVPPPASVGSAVVLASVAAKVLPLLDGEAVALARIAPPASLRTGTARLLAESRSAARAVRLMGEAARRGDIAEAQRQLAAFLTAREVARTRADALGLRCSG